MVFAQTLIVEVQIQLRSEFPRTQNLQSAFYGFRMPRWYHERHLALRTEAAILPSAIGNPQDSNRMVGRVVNLVNQIDRLARHALGEFLFAFHKARPSSLS